MDIRIRPVRAQDAQAIYEIRIMSGVRENMLAMPTESFSKSEKMIAGAGTNFHAFTAILVQDDASEKVIGMAGLQVYESPRLRHSGGIGIQVHRDYQGMGAGQKLMEAILDLADNWLMLVRVELGVYTCNEKAIRLYEKMGFEREGIKRKAAIRNGEYADELMMARIRNC
ncbi:MAG: GNAT family N-acetyltransferase [Clostridiales bacterium]|nr:GNAT family N-acetyltransferase [Clostridiales bacterium]